MHRPYRLIVSRFEFYNWPRPVGEENTMQSLCNLTILTSHPDDVCWLVQKPHLFSSQREPTLLRAKDSIGLIKRRRIVAVAQPWPRPTANGRRRRHWLAPCDRRDSWHPRLFVPPQTHLPGPALAEEQQRVVG